MAKLIVPRSQSFSEWFTSVFLLLPILNPAFKEAGRLPFGLNRDADLFEKKDLKLLTVSRFCSS